MARRHRRSRAIAAAAAATAIPMTVIALLVPASPAGAETDMEIEAGWDGTFVPGQSLPVRVRINADRLIRGVLEIQLRPTGDSTVTTLPVEVPGGSVKEYLVVVPTLGYGGTDVRVRAVLEAGGDSARAEADIEHRPELEIVGLLPGISPRALPNATPLAMGVGTAHFVEIDEAALAAGPGALEGIGTIVAGADEVGGLDADGRRSLLAWVSDGGRLLVDAQPGETIAGLPEEWQPADSGRMTAARGEIRATGGAAAAERWDDILEPTPTLSPEELSMMSVGSFGPTSVGDSIARDTGLKVAALGWLLGFLLIYILLVGPVTHLILRWRGRPGWGWVVIPALAVVFSMVSFVVGRDLRSGTRAAQSSVVETTPAGAVATSFVGLVSRNGGDGEVSFPAGWSAGAVDQSFFTGMPGTPVSVVQSSDGPDGLMELDAGQFGLISGEGPVQLEGGLEVSGTVALGGARGTVVNTTRFSVEEVAVFVGGAGTNIGSLAPGQEANWVISAQSLDPSLLGERRADIFEPVEVDVWRDAVGFDRPPDPDTIVNVSLFSAVRSRAGNDYFPSGSATAVGWTRDLRLPIDAGPGTTTGRSAVVGRAVLEPDGDGIGVLAVRRELLRGINGSAEFAREMRADRDDFSLEASLFRFVLPPGVDDDVELEIQVPAYIAHVQVWAGSDWKLVEGARRDVGDFDFGDPSSVKVVGLPAGVVHDGVIFARVAMSSDFGFFDGANFNVRSAS